MKELWTAIESSFVKNRFETLEKPDIVRVENTLAMGRAFLSICSFFAIYLDATEPARFAELAYTLLLAHVSYSLCIVLYATTLSEKPRIAIPDIQRYIHIVDVLWAIVLTLFSNGPTSSPFFAFFIFVLVSAAYRWYMRETILTTAILVLIMLSESLVLQYATDIFGPDEQIEVNWMIVRASYMAMVGVLFGYLSSREKHQRTEISLIADIGRNLRAELGMTGAVNATIELLMHIFDAGEIRLWTHDRRTQQLTTWTGLRTRSGLEISSSEEFVESEDAAVMPARAAFYGWFVFRDEWTASVAVFHPSRAVSNADGRHFLEAAMDQIGPGLYSVCLVDLLRSRAGAMERARLARELHDGIIQSVASAEMRTEVLRRKIERGDPVTPAELENLQELLHTEVLSLRELMQQMKPLEVGPKELLDFMAEQVDRFRRDSGIVMKFHSDLHEVRLSPGICQEIARIVQELLTNIRKHSSARCGLVRFGFENGNWQLTVEDDGRGFSFTGRRTLAELDRAHQGPLIVKERVRSIGGDLNLESNPGKGSTIQISFSAKENERSYQSYSYSHR